MVIILFLINENRFVTLIIFLGLFFWQYKRVRTLRMFLAEERILTITEKTLKKIKPFICPMNGL